MKNGRCRMHGGKSSGAPKGNQNALKHGNYTAAAQAALREKKREIRRILEIERRKFRQLLRNGLTCFLHASVSPNTRTALRRRVDAIRLSGFRRPRDTKVWAGDCLIAAASALTRVLASAQFGMVERVTHG